jgi:ferredoxin-NADP reductase
MRAIVRAITPLGDSLIALTLQTDSAQPHRAGQYSVLSLPGVDEAAFFSIESLPLEQPLMRFFLRLGEAPIDTAIAALQVGDSLDAGAPTGAFAAAEDGDLLVFAAGGTGITPLIAMLKQLIINKDRRRLHLIYAVRSRAEVGLADSLRLLSAAGVMVRLVIGEPLQLTAADLNGDAVRLHICGSEAMVATLTDQAKALGVDTVLTEPDP